MNAAGTRAGLPRRSCQNRTHLIAAHRDSVGHERDAVPILIREATDCDRPEWLRMRNALWPGSLADHDVETQRYFARAAKPPLTFIAELDGRAVGFLELELRSYAPGCESRPVPFIEGWYVDPEHQRRGIGRALVKAAEAWALANGYAEIASDIELENATSHAAHLALGFEETDRIISFRRALR
jgi:aminoglycoside 6'-N-acetyltransferase I